MVGSFDDQVPVVGFSSMKNLNSLVISVNTVPISKDVKVPSSNEGNLQRDYATHEKKLFISFL